METYPSPNYTPGESNLAKRSPEYASWANMMTRCYNQNRPCWHNYGGKGVRVCERWKDYKNFLADMGRMPAAQFTLDRIDPSKGYEPGNCQWISRADNARKVRKGRVFTAWGESKVLTDWRADPRCRLPASRLLANGAFNSRLARGWSVEEALSTPTNIYHRKSRVSLRAS